MFELMGFGFKSYNYNFLCSIYSKCWIQLDAVGRYQCATCINRVGAEVMDATWVKLVRREEICHP